MEIKSYSQEVMYQAGMSAYKGDNAPMTFTGANGFLFCTGEGGNRHIFASDNKGVIDIYVDSHVYGGSYAAMVTTRIRSGEPSGRFVMDVLHIVQRWAGKTDECFSWYTNRGLDEMFERLYKLVIKPTWL